MKLKIVSDGTPMGTTVVNADTGEELEGVVAVRWELDARGKGKAEISLMQMTAELIGWSEKPEAKHGG